MTNRELVGHMLGHDSTLGVNGATLKGIADALRTDHGHTGMSDRQTVEEAHANIHDNEGV